MELFELVLVLLACVIGSSVLDQFVPRVSLPLVQIAVGLGVALAVPEASHVHIEAELFLVLFIAPLLFNEARESDKRALVTFMWPVVSMAVGLVIATVLIVGFALNLIVPSIPLAAAFALAAALGPTDAAAVAALGSNVNLTRRQHTLLSGESLINDASGVVSFQFAIAAAVTGAFSLHDATVVFAVSFFGGIALGAALGLLARFAMALLRSRGLVTTTMHVLYEVFTPFVVFLATEAAHFSGILAVVAAGLMMAQSGPRLATADDARRSLVSHSVWEMVVFLINGVIFVMLGMQLPLAAAYMGANSLPPAVLVTAVVLIVMLILGTRFLWVAVMELVHRDPESGRRGADDPRRALRDSLVTTIAGPKGAITLSIILTVPLVTDQGAPFPARDLMVFLAAAVILTTLVIADVGLPLLAPKPQGGQVDPHELRRARIDVLRGTIEELRGAIGDGQADYGPALQKTIARYQMRINRERYEMHGRESDSRDLMEGVFDRQQRRLDQLRAGMSSSRQAELVECAPWLRGIRATLGYYRDPLKVGAGLRSRKDAMSTARRALSVRTPRDDAFEGGYFQALLAAIEMERAAVAYLTEEAQAADDAMPRQVQVFTAEGDYASLDRAALAEVMLGEHEAYLRILENRARLVVSAEVPLTIETTLDEGVEESFEQVIRQKFSRARAHGDEVDASALTAELTQINTMMREKRISPEVARVLREDVYALQAALQDRA
ncbi:Na+/H+ antiporter [Eggerthellaceae bacterium zg-1084]|uniref:Na+/H+ antiporter n=1 Tax=Berryella wangjianweii TaxID=2734634 RepID=UPI001556B64F|nr:Na+/H+ antiporter [Berryella wangjianweii]NPD31021.1 Na+/H+ antiporter [Berryella wangjianweii]